MMIVLLISEVIPLTNPIRFTVSHPFCPTISEEELRAMTFQVGFTTSEGVLLASDLKKTPLYGYSTPRHESKIVVADSGNFAHCSAGDHGFTNLVIDEIEKERRKGTAFIGNDILATRNILEKCLRRAQRRDKKYRLDNSISKTKGGYTMLVFRENGALAFWTVDSFALIPEIKMVFEGDIITGGNESNPAVFFANKYAKHVLGDLKAFIPLAVHTVLMAKNDLVDGVQIGIFTRDDEFRILTETELQTHKDLSAAIDSDIRRRLVP